MTSTLTPDGPPEPTSTLLEPCAAIGARFTVGRYTFERIPRATAGPGSRGRWGCSADGRGTMNYRTPLGAFLALQRFLRAP